MTTTSRNWVVGDVHGCFVELTALLNKIVVRAPGTELGPGAFDLATTDRLIFVGDYVDRGPQSALVITKLMDLERKYGSDRVVCLMGNHESMLLCGDYRYAKRTFTSYGNVVPSEHWRWMEALRKYYDGGNFVVAHAAMTPGADPEHTVDDVLLWQRYARGAASGLGKHLYHGHTPYRMGVDRAHDRTNVDCGCVYGGHLVAALVGPDGAPLEFVYVDAEKNHNED